MENKGIDPSTSIHDVVEPVTILSKNEGFRATAAIRHVLAGSEEDGSALVKPLLAIIAVVTCTEPDMTDDEAHVGDDVDAEPPNDSGMVGG
jgi:hypothetical protein